MNRLTLFLRYLIYPAIWGGAFYLITYLLGTGVNTYLATLPVIAGAAVAVLLLERWLPYEIDWLRSKHGDLNLDTVHYLVNYGIKVVAQLLIVWLGQSLVISPVFPTQWPLWGQILLALTLIDFCLFAVHALSHRYQWLWKLHAIHHSSERLYWLNGDKRHPIHQVLEGLPGIILCVLIGTPLPVIAGALAVLAVNMMLQHANIDYRAGWLKHLFSVAELHRWHHRADYHDAQVNYGAWLVVWDKLFGTFYDAPSGREQIGAIGIAEEPDFPRTYPNQLRYPFGNQRKQSRTLSVLIPLLASQFIASSPLQRQDALVGNWRLADNRTIQIYPKADSYEGKIAGVDKSAEHPEAGLIVIRNLRYDQARDEWSGDHLQLPEMEHSVQCVVKLKNNTVAVVTAYHGFRWLGKNQLLTRVPQLIKNDIR